MSNDNFLAGKHVLISGGTSGINLGIAKVLAGLGADVAVFGRDADKAARAAAEIGAAGPGKAIGLAADVRDEVAIGRIVTDTVEALGPLDIVIAGAAGNFPAPVTKISPNGFKAVVDIDLLGTYNLFWKAYEHLNKPGASLIAISAPQGSVAMPFQAHVCAAKAGINMLIQCLALEWGAAGVRVNGISPGPINGTEGVARLAPTEAIRKAWTDRIAMKRFGEAEEIGQLTAFLCSDQAAYITGTIGPSDGGMEVGDATPPH